MSTENIGERVEIVSMFTPQNVNNTPINGAAIVNAHKTGRQLSLMLIAGAMAATDVLTVSVQGSLDGGSTFENVLDKDGNALVFTAAKTSDAGQLDDGTILGTIPLDRANKRDTTNDKVRDTPIYDAYRVVAVNAVAQNVLLGVIGLISDLFELPGAEVDDLLLKVLPAPTL